MKNTPKELDLSQFENAPWSYEKRTQTILDKNGDYVAMIRGWGNLTGKGHAALGLSDEDAIKIQDDRGRRIANLPELLAEVKRLREHHENIETLLDAFGWDDAFIQTDESSEMLGSVKEALDEARKALNPEEPQ